MSLLIHGLAGTGWLPAVNFYFDNQIIIGVPGKGCYFFYDKDQLTEKYKDVQESIDSNPNFVADFRRRTDELFGAIFFKCIAIDEANLPLLPESELRTLYTDFVSAFTVAPIITAQLWGIEACLDEEYHHITKYLVKCLGELGTSEKIKHYKEVLSTNVGETVAFTEQKDFYRVASALDSPEMIRLFKENHPDRISEKLKCYPRENRLFEKHISKYAWMHTEYISGGWSREQWILLFQQALLDEVRPKEKLAQLLATFENNYAERQRAIDELQPSQEVLHAITALSELIAQRDWCKGYFTKILMSYHSLVEEIARRVGMKKADLLHVSYRELEDYFTHGAMVGLHELEKRKQHGFALVVKDGDMRLYTGKQTIQDIIHTENISAPFREVRTCSSFKGFPASRGTAVGKARVIEDASRLFEFRDGEIIVTYMTTMEFTPVFRKAKAVVTDEGGMSCHAAIVSREFGLPCIVGTNVATRVLTTGDVIEVDADEGVVRILE